VALHELVERALVAVPGPRREPAIVLMVV